MQMLNLISKEELLNQLKNQTRETGIWWNESDIDEDGYIDFSNLEGEFKHLVVSQKQIEFAKMYDIDLDDYCRENEIDFMSQTHNSEIEFLHATRVLNLENIKQMGLIVNDDATYIPDLDEGIYAVDIASSKGIDNLKTYLVDFPDEEILLVKGVYEGSYNYCVKGEDHEGYIVFHDRKVGPEGLSFEIVKLEDFFLRY